MVLLFNFLLCLKLVSAYNLDSKNVVVYTNPSVENRLKYFGFAVSIRPRAVKYVNDSWVIQIAAPRSNGSKPLPHQPGAVYRCFANGQCKIHTLDETGNKFEKQENIQERGKKSFKWLASERKDEGWVGVSMNLKDTPSGELSVVCGHRIAYQALHKPLGIADDKYLTVGGCYIENLDQTKPATFIMPLKEEDRAYKSTSSTEAYFDWGLGLAGMSAWLTSSGNGLLLGAPHVYYMTGTILAYYNGFTNPLVVDMSAVSEEVIRTDYFSYYGYSVTSGYFFDDRREWFIFGAPRSYGLYGRVFAAQIVEKKTKNTLKTILNIHPSIQRGETYGEYFGASVDVGDINNDGKDDLIVGAPMFSRRYPDQGRIYVFLGSKLGFETPLQASILDGTAPNGRFGTCVCVAGDLDEDGYKDVLVGAPNDKGTGAIYLYRGGPRGLSPSPAQIILGSSIHFGGLRGFGISISRAIDIDNNFYPDVVVGAYQSDQAVLLRTRPVVHFSSFISHPQFIDRKQTSFNITVCLAFFSKYPPPVCYVDATLVVDGVLSRCRFEKSSDTFIMDSVKVLSTSPSCRNLTIFFHMNMLNGTFNHPVHVALENTLHESKEIGKSDTVWADKIVFKEVFPIENLEMAKQKISVDVPFAGDCGIDNVCYSRLTLKCQLINAPGQVYVIGSTKPLLLKVLVQNSNEPAHYTFLHFKISGALASDMKLSDPDCEIDDFSNSVVCKLETLLEGAKKLMSFEFITDLWATTASSTINLTLYTSTSSNNTGGRDNKCAFSLSLISDAYAQLVGHPSVPTIVLSKDAPKLVNFSHHYEVEKTGLTPIRGILFSISIPTFYEQSMAFASFDKEIPHITVESEIDEYKIVEKKESDSFLYTRTFSEETDETSVESIPADKTLFLSCSSKHVTCKTYSYILASVQRSLDFSIILNISNLDPALTKYDVIYFSTNGSAVIKHVFRENDISRAIVSTSITKFMYISAVDTRVIVMSVLAGVFLLGLLIPLLIKNGFFRRKTKEQMEALKVQDMITQRFSIYEDTD